MPSERNAPSATGGEATLKDTTLEVCPTGPGLFSPSPVAEDDPLVQQLRLGVDLIVIVELGSHAGRIPAQ
ncbi:MAG: hypothetical protein F4151_17435 [Gammaproteobacteria bacterium]|nr:hypothetical protein [Gammaproteobacteria bacterium]